MSGRTSEPERLGYNWLTNVDLNVPFNARGFEKRIPPYTDGEIEKHYATQLGVPVNDILVTDAAAANFLRAVYRKA